MVRSVRKYSFVSEFECLGAECEDTCCKGWGMQLDRVRRELYEKEAPELLEAVTSGEAEFIMKRDPKTDYCVKFDNGLCKIHKEKGTKFLGDACHFYPRITRKFGDEVVMSAAMSCPEITRLTIFGEAPFSLSENDIERLPVEVKNYLPDSINPTQAFGIINNFIELTGDEKATPERSMAKIFSIASSLKTFDQSRWPDAIPMLIKLVDGRLLNIEENKLDRHMLLSTLAGLVHAAKKTARPRFDETFKAMERALGVEINPATLDIMQNLGEEDFPEKLKIREEKSAEKIAPILRRYLQAQIAMSGFPFSGFGRDIIERALILAVKFATIKLALTSHVSDAGDMPDEKNIIRIIQSISRFMDHLADPELSIKLYEGCGWRKDARIRALVGDVV